ncbi:MAG: acetate kinase [Piscirickettsiaceae bacterium]|nr:acetate kinase [Piscirickettsiaceae bacterium]
MASQTVLIINCGSATVKYQLLELPSEKVIVKGVFDGIGQQQASHCYCWQDKLGQSHDEKIMMTMLSYLECFKVIANVFSKHELAKPDAIGHRVVHGGELFNQPILIDDSVLAQIDQLSFLAPLHNPANVEGIKECLNLFPDIPQVAVFDTAFHQTLAEHVYRYPVPEKWYSEYHIRKYGFHGSSHHYVAQQAADYLHTPLSQLNLITLHLGNGDSMSAIKHGQCIDTSMGFTPLEGLMMGSRSGDIDPAISLHLQQQYAMTTEQVSDDLNHHSGLLAIAGSYDMRKVLIQREQGDRNSQLALDMYCYRIKKYIGSYIAVLGHVDALIFTGGVGENAAKIRWQACDHLNGLGIEIDAIRNEQIADDMVEISCTDSRVKVMVVRTNEELQIAREVNSFLKC